MYTSNKYQRKTKDVWEVQGHYPGHGWEAVTEEDNIGDARQRLQEYRDNEPRTPFKLVKKRERIESEPHTVSEPTNENWCDRCFRPQSRCVCWKAQLDAARSQISAELMRHAQVSKQNRHRCEMCYCCAAWTVLEERGLLV